MKQVNRDFFDRIGNDHKNWTRTANSLFAAATVLCREREKAEPKVAGVSKASMECLTSWIELMLFGFGIECLLKALWVKKGNRVAKEGFYLKVMDKENHDLVALSGKVDFPLNPEEAAVLTKLSELSRATGRYPITRRFTEMHHETEQWSSTEDHITETIVHRLKQEIAKAKATESPVPCAVAACRQPAAD